MKRFLLLIMIIIFVGLSIYAGTEENSFTLLLKKQGEDKLWFSTGTEKNDTKINSYVFPIVNGSYSSAPTATFYLHWEYNSGRNIKIRITFTGAGYDEKPGEEYMLIGTVARLAGTTRGLNYNVKVGQNIGSISFANDAERTSPAKVEETKKETTEDDKEITTTVITDKRVIEFSLPGSTKTSPAQIDITINPPYSDSGETASAKWGNEEQYVGYIVAGIYVQ